MKTPKCFTQRLPPSLDPTQLTSVFQVDFVIQLFEYQGQAVNQLGPCFAQLSDVIQYIIFFTFCLVCFTLACRVFLYPVHRGRFLDDNILSFHFQLGLVEFENRTPQ